MSCKGSISGAFSSHLYVTPLDERARTLCLFFLGPWLEDSSSLEPLDLERDLYTVAMVSVGIKAGLDTNSSRDVDGKTKLTLPGRISIWLPAKISGRCLSISRDGLARAGTWLCRGARSSAGTSCPDPPWRATSMSQLGGGLERWATHLSQTGVFRGPDRPNIVETIGVSVTKAEQRLLALSTCQCSHSDEGEDIFGAPPASWLPRWSRAALESSNKGHEHAGPWRVGAVSISLLGFLIQLNSPPDYDSELTARVQEAQSYTEKTAVKRVA